MHESVTMLELHNDGGALEVLLRAEGLTAKAMQHALDFRERALPARSVLIWQ
jgi:hypothetical protein